MWFSFCVTVGFGVIFVLVEVVLRRPLPFGVGLIPGAAISIVTNGWESFWHWRFYYHDKLCTRTPGGDLRCWDASARQVPDAARPPEPPGWIEVLLPWSGDQWPGHWLLVGVPLDLAAGVVAAALVWLALRPFGRHGEVDVNPLD